MNLEVDERKLIEHLQEGDVSHHDLYRRARRIHERELARVVQRDDGRDQQRPMPDLSKTAAELFDACVPAIPYAAAAAFLGREKQKLTRNDGDRPRVALIGEGLGSMHGVTHTIRQLRDRGVPGFEVEVIGTDADVDRRLSAVAEVDIPFYEGMKIGVPSMHAITDAIAEGRYDLVHVTSPGPAGIAAWGSPRRSSCRWSAATTLSWPPTPDCAQAGHVEMMAKFALGKFYGACDVVLTPSAATDEKVLELGVEPEKIGRWDRGVDLSRFDPALRDESLLPGEINVLYAGRLTKEKGVDLLAEAFEQARSRDPRLHLVLAGGGPEEDLLRERLSEHATFLGWQHGADLARVYASADVFLFASQTDTFGNVILEAQASGLPVVAVAEGGPVNLISDGETGLLCTADAGALATAVHQIVDSPLLAERLRRAALVAVGARTWDAALGRLADGYRRALALSAEAALERDVA